jgi:hypothetical protein
MNSSALIPCLKEQYGILTKTPVKFVIVLQDPYRIYFFVKFDGALFYIR